MPRLLAIASIVLCAASCTTENGTPEPDTERSEMQPTPAGLYALQVDTLEGEPADLARYAGSVSLVVNVASECGYTPQYAGLQKLHEELRGRGFQVLAFPSNDFGAQEPGSPEEIREFCTTKFAVTFPVFEKVATKGDEQSKVYATLEAMSGEVPSWNFCKYLVGKDGRCLGFWKSKTAPDDAELRAAIEQALGA